MKNLNDLQNLVSSLALNAVQAKKLNMSAGNAMRRIVRANLKAQKDTGGKAFSPRKKSTYVRAASGKISLNTKMFRSAGRSLNQDADADGVAVGYSDKFAKIFKIHNFGGNVKFKKKSGKYVSYAMTQRQFLGWNTEMIKQVETAVVDQYLKFQGA